MTTAPESSTPAVLGEWTWDDQALQWLDGVHDPALAAERIHEAFDRIVLQFVPAEGDGDEDSETDGEDEEGEVEELEDDMAEAARELEGDGDAAAYDDDDEGSNALSNISEREEQERLLRGGDGEADEEGFEGAEDFQQWITHGGEAFLGREEEGRIPLSDEALAAKRAVEVELARVELAECDATIATEDLPERFKIISLRERRPRLGAKILDGRAGVVVPIPQEAVWILRQLVKPGRPYHGNPMVTELLRDSFDQITRHELTRAIEYAIEKMRLDFMEPAHLMLYHQGPLSPLLYALWSDSSVVAEWQQRVANPSLSYCLATGRRQKPTLSRRRVHNAEFAGVRCPDMLSPEDFAARTQDIGSDDPNWEHVPQERDVRGKPCFIELGRLLVVILELDVECFHLEHVRQQQLKRLRELGTLATEQVRILESAVHDDPVDAFLWSSFIKFLVSLTEGDDGHRENGNRRGSGAVGATKRLQLRGIDNEFESFALNGLRYHDNLFHRRALHTVAPDADLYSLPHRAALTAACTAGEVLNLFERAVVEQYSCLPILRRRVHDAYCTDGLLIVERIRGQNRERKVVPIRTLIHETPAAFMDLLQEERSGMVNLEFFLPIDVVLHAMNTHALGGLLQPLGDDTCSQTLRAAWHKTATRLLYNTREAVRTTLQHVAQLALQRGCSERLGAICAEGPYERTMLNLAAYDVAKKTWEPEWNVTEALPAAPEDNGSFLRTGTTAPRVCAAYRGENGVTCFTCIDECGAVLGHTRWKDCAQNTLEGLEQHKRQLSELGALLLDGMPVVIGVAAVHPDCPQLMRVLDEFCREKVSRELGKTIAVVWVSAAVALVAARSTFTEVNMQAADAVTRTATGVARYLQDPLREVCRLFDARDSVLKLPIGIHPLANRSRLTEWLEWEVSLWVTACGVNLEELYRLPDPADILRFVAGMGRRKAQHLWQFLRGHPVASRTQMSAVLREHLGRTVERNASSSLRIFRSTEHPLDRTLIPDNWYCAAEWLSRQIMLHAPPQPRRNGETDAGDEAENNDGNREEPTDGSHEDSDGSGYSGYDDFVAVLLFTEHSEDVKRECMRRALPSIERLVDDIDYACRRRLSEADVLLIQHELLHFGRSYVRRPYRCITSRLFFKLLTGIRYVSKSEQVQSTAASNAGIVTTTLAPSPLVICEGEVIQGVIERLRSGNVQGISIVTTRGVSAFMAVEDVPDQVLQNELRDHISYVDRLVDAKKRGETLHEPQRMTPKWLERRSVIHGIAVSCNYERCELRLRWCKATEGAGATHAAGDTADATGDYGDAVLETRSANSILTADLLEAARVNVLKIARHDLFHMFSRTAAEEYLQTKPIGTCIIRQSRHRKNEAILVIKIGRASVVHWPIREERMSSGALMYTIIDHRTRRRHEFQDVDHCIETFVKPTVERVLALRRHRKFVADSRDMALFMEEDRARGRIPYCFVETPPPPAGVEPLPHQRTALRYAVSVLRKGRSTSSGVKHFKVHIDHTHYYVQLPVVRPTGSSDETEWVPCATPEALSFIVKAFETQVRERARR